MTQLTKVERLVQEYGHKTDLKNRLSYDTGVTNIVGVIFTNQQIRLRYENYTSNDILYYFSPVNLIGVQTVDNGVLLNDYPQPPASISTFNQIVRDLNLPNGIPFYVSLQDGNGDVAYARSMDEDRKLYVLASSMNETAIQIKGINLRSFDINGKPENSNYGNSITPYNVNAYRDKKRRAPINLSSFQSSKDYSTEILKINLLQHNLVLPVSQEDLFTFKVNARTKLDVTLELGARDSRTERFFRDLKEGVKLLQENFSESLKKENCSDNK